MKTVKVELTIDQWKLEEDIDNSYWLPNAVESIVDNELDFLKDALNDGLDEYITDANREKVEDEIRLTVNYVKNSISGTIHNEECLIESSDYVHGLMYEINEQAKTQ